ncbi:MAG: hypothetical protein WA949_10040 [Phormidesmis sp.]
MRLQTLLPVLGLFCVLSACAGSSNSSSVSPETLLGDRTPTDTPAKTCNLNNTPSPLGTPENAPVFEQFNFRPEEIAIDTNTVTFKTPYYDFTLCKGDRTWTITSVSPENQDTDADFDYQQMLAGIANPDYSTIEVDGKTYEYRVRLQADWLNEQLDSATELPVNPDSSTEEASTEEASTEEAVYFELQLPDGELLTEELYTLSDLQTAQLGASLGDPNIAGAVAAEGELWIATSASQGEGNSGFASLIHYSPETEELSVEQPDELQGNQITAIAATNNNALTLWLGTKIGGEGNPNLPADGLVAYQPDTQQLTTYSVENSPLVSAIPYRLAAEEDALWIATGEGVCQVEWKTVDSDQSWNCWQFATTADLPAAGVELYPSFLSTEPATTLNQDSVEVLWASETFEDAREDASEDGGKPAVMRYEVVYEPGFEIQIPQGGYRLTNEVARRTGKGEDIFWPGRAWHWEGDRFTRSLDEVGVNMFGGGPYGLAASTRRDGLNLDSDAIRGDFDLLDITAASTQVRHYSGWIESSNLSVYPTVIPVDSPTKSKPNPLIELAENLPDSPGP